ncbi:uncharacterized protein LACBIDRAFT_310677 [Laccaria bicolor S238N-H82]|uniref:Predicted protein n=1 Tax=Laccaria bicolor (strain S238N-H82 / ATCC MYA-4686) TaxID=486041 RepID=B0DUV8_LACBS|nr:uncharacterized protein LACBIDRAFT_310677 [Laccaria bicolor S238N-H82]EDR01611.1 predicted protein [Laccaria bicolor S238N-H82]|eukprot:XP_001887687.1 predicted protein [Laccaria bicolor S238N-H82]
MPEDPEISVIIHQILAKIVQLAKKEGKAPMAYLRLFSWCFTLGTKAKPYSSISVDNSRYTESFDSDDDSYVPNAFDMS